MQKFLIVLGVLLLVAGLAWPILSTLRVGRLPGDIIVQRDSFTIYIPITTMILVSLFVSLLFWLFRR